MLDTRFVSPAKATSFNLNSSMGAQHADSSSQPVATLAALAKRRYGIPQELDAAQRVW